jgi:3-oxoacyl-[acyl-carrier protein] reductase
MNSDRSHSGSRRALVTGGSGAIGAAICRTLAASGIHVVIHSHRQAGRVLSLIDDIESCGGQASAISFDISDDAQVGNAIDTLLKTGPIQILVNNAGMHDDALMAGMGASQWNDVINTNLNGFFRVTQPLLLPMVHTRWGRIITIGSVAGLAGNRGQANYAAAKAGLQGASKSLSLEVASRGITVNVVAPGVIDTGMSKPAFPLEKIKAIVPAGRAGNPEDVAALVGFLASDAAGYITGQVISVNGGLY